jgi:hypothetical protein
VGMHILYGLKKLVRADLGRKINRIRAKRFNFADFLICDIGIFNGIYLVLDVY